jgi:hypothetical protein
MLDVNKLKPSQGALFPVDPNEEDKKQKEASEKRYKEKKDHVKKFGGRRYGKGSPPISEVRELSKWNSLEKRMELASCIRLADMDDKNFVRIGLVSKMDIEHKTDKSLKVNGIWLPISQTVKVKSHRDIELHVKDWFVKKNKESFKNNFGIGA